MMKTNPIIGFLRTLMLFLMGKIKFIKADIGKEITTEEGMKFKVFRHVIIHSEKNVGNPQAVFRLRFQPKNMTVEENKRFSKLPMLVFMGFRGFRSKYWMVNKETGICLGVYEWDTFEDAERYSESIALRFITLRSVEGSVSFEIESRNENSLQI